MATHLREPLLAQASVCLPRQAACLGKALGNGLGKLLAWARAGQAVWGKQKRSGEVRLGFCHTLPGQACETTCLGKALLARASLPDNLPVLARASKGSPL